MKSFLALAALALVGAQNIPVIDKKDTTVTGPCPSKLTKCLVNGKYKCCTAGQTCTKTGCKSFLEAEWEGECPNGEASCDASGHKQCCLKGESCVPRVGCVCSTFHAKVRRCTARENKIANFLPE